MDEVKYGMLTLYDDKNRPQPVRLQLTNETLTILKEELVPVDIEEEEDNISNKVRNVVVEREDFGGLGLSVKGGSETKLPILISKIVRNQAAARTQQLFVGDAILKVNNYSLEGFHHDDVVEILKNSGDVVTLTVKYFKPASHFLKAGNENILNNNEELCTFGTQGLPSLQKQWSTVVSIPLLYGYMTRYCSGTDKLRTNAFEVVGVDGTTTGILHCDDNRSLAEWIRAISNHITSLLTQVIKMSNRLMIPEEQITHMDWVCQRGSPCRYWQAWRQKFLALKGNNVYLFDLPPMQARDWGRCDTVFKVYECMFQVLKDEELCDDRQHSCCIKTGTGETVYLSVESRPDLLQLERSWYKTNHLGVTHLKVGVSLLSCTGKLSFTQEVECTNLQTLMYTIHAFLSAKLASVDPGFLSNY
ncbi:hypothetical protein ScPMuIL_008003 [Solemya velum]